MSRTPSPDFPGWYIDFLTALMKQAPRPGEIDQTTAKGWFDNQASLKQTLAGVLLPTEDVAPAAAKFEFVKSFEIVVHQDYDPKTQLKSFRKKDGKSLSYCNDDLTDANFANVSAQLKPGQRILVSVHRQMVSGTTTSEERMTYLRGLPDNKFYAAQGASLVYAQQRDQLERGFAYVAMDEKDRLWKDSGGDRGVPFLYCVSGGGCEFGLGDLEYVWRGGDLLLSFSDISA